jgi:spore coat assemly protein
MINIGDVVARKSYNLDIIFEVIEINEDIATIVGKTIRLVADAPLDDLVIISDEDIRRDEEKETSIIESLATTKKSNSRRQFLTGKILHLDGDERYMKKCLELYKKVGVYAVGIQMKEREIPNHVLNAIKYFNPDIIVITGHDSYNKQERGELDNYRNSKYFIEATKLIRKQYPVLNQPIIIAGACQSHFEAIIAAGANFASSPSRVNIQSLDPAIIAIKCCSTSINEVIKVSDAIARTSNKTEGLGGIESFGTMKTLYF